MAPFVSIIVNCFNQARYLDRSVKSVLEQTFNDIECIIVDDGSTDNTRQVSKYLMTVDSRVKYYYKENGGLPAARNFGVQHVKGEWIQCLDADDWIHEDKIRFQLDYCRNYDSQDIVLYSDYERVFLDSTQTILQSQSNIVGQLTHEQLIQRLLLPDFLADSPHPSLQQCMLIKKSVFSKKMFNENLRALGDRYFALELLVEGVNFIYTPIVGAFYTKHQSNRTNNWQYMKNYYILFYETVYKNHENLLSYSQVSLEFFINETLREKDKHNFERLARIVHYPVNLFAEKVKINNKATSKLIYLIRMITPSFLLYEKYRGPRSKKLLVIWSNLLNFLKKPTNSNFLL